MHTNISPTALAQCRARLIQTTDTTDTPDISQIRHDWATLNAARGKQVQPARLGEPHHLIKADPHHSPVAPAAVTAADIQARALPKTLACIQARGIIPMSARAPRAMGGAA